MHRWIRALEVMVITLLVIVSAVVVNRLGAVREIQAQATLTADYHVAVITDETASYGMDLFVEGLDAAGINFNMVYEMYEISETAIEATFQAVSLTDVDAVVVKLSNNTFAREWIQALKEEAIFVVLIGNDDPESNRDVYIGTNKYQMGKEVATLAGEAIDHSGEIAVIFGSAYNENAVAYNHFISGMTDIVKNSWDLKLERFQFSQEKRAEVITDELLNISDVGVIVCTDPTDVNRAMRVLVDRNAVGKVKVIGNGLTPDIESYIEQDIVFASIVEDYKELGYLSMTYLNDLFQGKTVSGYVNVPYEVIRSN